MTVTPGAHLTRAQTDALGRELDAIADEIRADLGERDQRYIHKVIDAQRRLELAGRATLLFSILPPAWLAGTTLLSASKIIASMEIGHNVLHGQWDWMRDPAIHSSTWEWDNFSTSEGWKRTHNHIHHTYTNVLGKDRDLGYTIMRVSGDQKWRPIYLAQPVYNIALAATFEFAIALYDLEFDELVKGNLGWGEYWERSKGMFAKVGRQSVKDYVVWPALSGLSAPTTFAANLTANVARNVWAHTIIFCGHFPDGGATFSMKDVAGESRGEWYLRQMEGSCNIEGGPLLHLMSGNLSFQIEHHIFPDIPSNRYKEVAPRVREICDRYGIDYSTGSLAKQYGQVVRKIVRFAFPGGRKTNEGQIDPERTSRQNPREAATADVWDRRQVTGVRSAGFRLAPAAEAAVSTPPTKKAAGAAKRATPSKASSAAKKTGASKASGAAKKAGTTKASGAARPKAKSAAAKSTPTTVTAKSKPAASRAKAASTAGPKKPTPAKAGVSRTAPKPTNGTTQTTPRKVAVGAAK